MNPHKYRRLADSKLLHVSTDQAVVGSERWIVETPVVQVIVSGVEVPVGGQTQPSQSDKPEWTLVLAPLMFTGAWSGAPVNKQRGAAH